MTNKEAVNWLINLMSDIGKAEHRDLWHYEQALMEIRQMLEAEPSEKSMSYSDGFVDGYAQGKRGAEPEWIPVSERLPECDEYVLMTTAWGSVTIGERIYPIINNTVYFIHEGNTNAELDDVIAWMPLPSPYRGESE